MNTSAIKQTKLLAISKIIICKQSCQNRSKTATDTMYANGPDRIVDLQLLIYKLNTKYNRKARDHSNECRSYRCNSITAGRNCYQSSQRSIQCHGNIRLLITYPCDNENGHGRHRCCQIRRIENPCRICRAIPGQCNGRASVKSKPAEPENKYTKCCKCHAVTKNRIRFAIFIIFSNTRSKDRRTYKRCNAAYHMYRRRPRKIMESQLRQPSAAPDPVSGNRIYKQTDQRTVNAVRRKFCTLCHCA